MSDIYLKTIKAAEDINSIQSAMLNKQAEIKDQIEKNNKIEKVKISSRRIEKMSTIIPMQENPKDDISEQIFDVLKSILE